MLNSPFDSVLAAVLIMAVMTPLIFLFRVLPRWGVRGYRLAAVIVWSGAVGLLALAVQGIFRETVSAWFGIVGGLLAWTLAELSHETGQANIEDPKMLPMLGLSSAVLVVLWRFLPMGAQFWAALFMLNWVGHVFIRFCQTRYPRETTSQIFTVTAAGFGLLMLALIILPFVRPLAAIPRLWSGIGIWFSLSMIFFLTLYPNRLDSETG